MHFAEAGMSSLPERQGEGIPETTLSKVAAENAERIAKSSVETSKDLQDVTSAVRRLLEGALAAAAEVPAGEEEDLSVRAEAALLAMTTETAGPEEAGAALARVQALLDRTWERLNTGHWSAVPLARRRLYALASLHKVWLLLVQQRAGLAEDDTVAVLRATLVAADRGLLLGAPLPLGVKDGTGCALAEAAAAISHALSCLHCTFQEQPTEEKQKILLNCMTSIAPPNVSARIVPTLHQPSLQRFANNYFTPRLPVHLVGAANHWPARHRWCNLEYLCHVAGARTVPVELGAHYVDPNWAQRLMTLETFVKKHVECHTPDQIAKDENLKNAELGYLAQHPLFDQVPELRGDICIPEYCCISDELDGPLDPDINAWFGPAGTVSPLHFDPKHNLLTQVVGSKRVLLYCPEESAALYPHEGTLLKNTAQVDPEEPDYKRFPAFKKAAAWECTLQPGDMLYIPPKWWHHVRSLSISFSVSFWWK